MAKSPKTPVIAITGATGFIGRNIMFYAFNNGCRVRALTRTSGDDAHNLTWVRGSLEDPSSLKTLLDGADTVIHAAALVKTRDTTAFDRVNRQGTENLVKILSDNGPKRLVHISSYAAREPELSAYAKSKADAEDVVKSSSLNWTILRPPAVYGPGDREFVRLLQWMKKGYAFSPSGEDHRFAIMHAQDLASLAVLLARGNTGKGKIIEADDGHAKGYCMDDLAKVASSLFTRSVRTVRLSHFSLMLIGAMGSLWETISKNDVMLTRGKAREMIHQDWTAQKALRPKLKSWTPAYDLETGMERSFLWYQRAGLL